MTDYSKYLSFYPKKVLAIKELRLDTGMNLTEAKEAIDELFKAYELESGENECGYMSKPVNTKVSKHMNKYNDQKAEERQRQWEKKEKSKQPHPLAAMGCLALFSPIIIALGVIFELASEYGGPGCKRRGRRRRRRW